MGLERNVVDAVVQLEDGGRRPARRPPVDWIAVCASEARGPRSRRL